MAATSVTQKKQTGIILKSRWIINCNGGVLSIVLRMTKPLIRKNNETPSEPGFSPNFDPIQFPSFQWMLSVSVVGPKIISFTSGTQMLTVLASLIPSINICPHRTNKTAIARKESKKTILFPVSLMWWVIFIVPLFSAQASKPKLNAGAFRVGYLGNRIFVQPIHGLLLESQGRLSPNGVGRDYGGGGSYAELLVKTAESRFDYKKI
jgi:hypothetical protein